MNPLQHIVEPERLLLTWQPSDESAQIRTRRVVGEVCPTSDGHAVFRYLKDSSDYQKAVAGGFKGFSAFPLEKAEVSQGVVESLVRRLPPRKREDFAEYLARHWLPFPFNHSDIALLGYTGARLPSDGFALVPIFPTDAVPCEYVMEIAGHRYVMGDKTIPVCLHEAVTFELDPTNPVDLDALAVVHQGQMCGYVNRALRHMVQGWLRSHSVSAVVEKINGKPERPLIYVKITVT